MKPSNHFECLNHPKSFVFCDTNSVDVMHFLSRIRKKQFQTSNEVLLHRIETDMNHCMGIAKRAVHTKLQAVFFLD